MSVTKFRWSQVYESSEEELVAFLHAREVSSERNHLEADTEQLAQHVAHPFTVWCAEGSLVIETESVSKPLQTGDALRVDSPSSYSIRAGIAGCVFYLSLNRP